MADRSCASSSTTWPNRCPTSSSEATSSSRTWSAAVHLARAAVAGGLLHVSARCSAASSRPSAHAARCSGSEYSRNSTSRGLSTGQIASTTARVCLAPPSFRVALSLSDRPRISSLRRTRPAIRSLSRSLAGPNGLRSRSRSPARYSISSGWTRTYGLVSLMTNSPVHRPTADRSARSSTVAIRASPFTEATAGSSTGAFSAPTSPATETCLQSISPRAGSTREMWCTNVSFGPTTSAPCRRTWWCSKSRNATRCSPTAVLPVPGPPCTTSESCTPSRTMWSWSGWIVATMSRIGP